MPCGGKTTKSDLPIINSQVRLGSAVLTKATIRSGKTVQVRRRVILDFHCPVCGITKPGYPNYWHKCPGPQPVPYQIARAAICNSCPHNRDGVCLPLRTKQPGKPCLIEIGISMPEVECPLKKWKRVLFKCDKCGSVRFDENGLSECTTCHPRPKSK